MNFGVHSPQIIQDPSKGRESQSKLADGIIQSSLNPEQVRMVEGIVNTGMPASRRSDDAHSTRGIDTSRVKASKTVGQIGARSYPGAPAPHKK